MVHLHASGVTCSAWRSGIFDVHVYPFCAFVRHLLIWILGRRVSTQLILFGDHRDNCKSCLQDTWRVLAQLATSCLHGCIWSIFQCCLVLHTLYLLAYIIVSFNPGTQSRSKCTTITMLELISCVVLFFQWRFLNDWVVFIHMVHDSTNLHVFQSTTFCLIIACRF